MHLNETQTLSNPRDALLTSKVIKFIDQIGANEILFAAHLGPLHLSHPSLPRIDHSHVLILQIEVDPDASDRPLREQYQIFNWGLETVKQVVSAKTPTGKQKTSSDDAWKLTHRRPMMKDENGCVDYEYNIIFTGFWKEASEERRTISFVRGYGAWIQVNKPGTEREYDAICDGWFEFLQQSMLGPAQQFRHLFDRKVDLATRSFDFGKLEEGRLPSRDSPGYQAAREAMFRREEEFRNMMRQVLSVQPRGLDGGMLCKSSFVVSSLLVYVLTAWVHSRDARAWDRYDDGWQYRRHVPRRNQHRDP
jgi:hypothetical protein